MIAAPPMPAELGVLAVARREALAAFERDYLVEVLARAHGSISAAAKLAGVDRANFRRLLRRHGLHAHVSG
ncbi:MAG: helix-turn-helix domain-containing protein [Kofleriaceae bacterium]